MDSVLSTFNGIKTSIHELHNSVFSYIANVKMATKVVVSLAFITILNSLTDKREE